MSAQKGTGIVTRTSAETLEWLLDGENPAVAVLTRRTLLREADAPETAELWARRNSYGPVAAILDAMHEDGSWDAPSRDYQKYRGSLWQIHFLGELHADGEDERVRAAAEYAFSRQLADGSFSCNGRPSASIPCLTANVSRALARLGYADDDRVLAALGFCVDVHRRLGRVDCSALYSQGGKAPHGPNAGPFTLNGYCHMLTVKLLLFLGEIPRSAWPDGAEDLRDDCIARLREKHVMRCLPDGAREFGEALLAASPSERTGVRGRFLAGHPSLRYGDKPGWLRFGYPLSYNSDALEALRALAGIGEPRRPEYEEALSLVADAADPQLRWTMRNSFNGKMIADVEAKGAPSRWLTLHGLQVLDHFGG